MSSPIADFEKELAAVAESGKGQVSQRRVQLLTKLALTHRKHYKLIVHAVEKFIHKARSDYKLPGLYVLDSIVRASKAKLNDNCYAERFGKNLALTVTTLLKTSSEHQIKMKKVFDIWHQKKIFPGPVLAGLLPSNQSPKIITDLSAGQSLSGGGGTAMGVEEVKTNQEDDFDYGSDEDDDARIAQQQRVRLENERRAKLPPVDISENAMDLLSSLQSLVSQSTDSKVPSFSISSLLLQIPIYRIDFRHEILLFIDAIYISCIIYVLGLRDST
eukprot:m.140627 g.140627  ORF g.140627 m.140627 type:complete len:273 (-) comp14830_c0_seq3:1402-2220(-)